MQRIPNVRSESEVEAELSAELFQKGRQIHKQNIKTFLKA